MKISVGVRLRLWLALKIELFLLLEAFHSCRSRVLSDPVCGSSGLGLFGVRFVFVRLTH